MIRIVCIVIGYIFGNFLTADVVARFKAGKRAREIGTGNPGTVNIGSELGVKWGVIVLAGDILKTLIPFILCRFVLFSDMGVTAALYAGIGTSFGHNFPFWNKFRGGKGVAVTCSYITFASPIWGLLANVTGLLTVVATGYLAVGAMVIPLLYLIPAFLFFGTEGGFAAAAGAIILLVRHIDSMQRMLAKTEEKVDLLKIFKRKSD